MAGSVVLVGAMRAAHITGLLFGAGQQERTTPETDGGNLIRKTIAYRNAGGTARKQPASSGRTDGAVSHGIPAQPGHRAP
jgi:hypothetical protein